MRKVVLDYLSDGSHTSTCILKQTISYLRIIKIFNHDQDNKNHLFLENFENCMIRLPEENNSALHGASATITWEGRNVRTHNYESNQVVLRPYWTPAKSPAHLHQ